MSPSEFAEATLRLFRFLEEQYGFRVVANANEASLPVQLRGYSLHYENRTTGVSIHLEHLEQLPVIHLHRLQDGEESHALGLLLLAVAPDMNPLASERSLPLKQSALTLLEKYAQALEAVGDAVLRGDFEIFPKLRKLAHEAMQRRVAGDPSFVFF